MYFCNKDNDDDDDINHFFFDTRERMGLTEFEAVEKMYNGVEEMIRMEKELEAENAGEE